MLWSTFTVSALFLHFFRCFFAINYTGFEALNKCVLEKKSSKLLLLVVPVFAYWRTLRVLMGSLPLSKPRLQLSLPWHKDCTSACVVHTFSPKKSSADLQSRMLKSSRNTGEESWSFLLSFTSGHRSSPLPDSDFTPSLLLLFPPSFSSSLPPSPLPSPYFPLSPLSCWLCLTHAFPLCLGPSVYSLSLWGCHSLSLSLSESTSQSTTLVVCDCMTVFLQSLQFCHLAFILKRRHAP